MCAVLCTVIVSEQLKRENLSHLITDRIPSLVPNSIVMLKISINFEEL